MRPIESTLVRKRQRDKKKLTKFTEPTQNNRKLPNSQNHQNREGIVNNREYRNRSKAKHSRTVRMDREGFVNNRECLDSESKFSRLFTKPSPRRARSCTRSSLWTRSACWRCRTCSTMRFDQSNARCGAPGSCPCGSAPGIS